MNLEPKYILLEKVIFQSKGEFKKSLELMRQHNVKVFGNLPRRYFESYKLIKSRNLKITKVSVTGPGFGLLCNSIHYIDLVQYLTNEKVINHCLSAGWSPTENRRGTTYLEGEGTLNFTTETGVALEIVSDSSMYTDVVVEIKTDETIFRFNETNSVGVEISGNGIQRLDFNSIYSSILTGRALDDMLVDCCLFPELYELSLSHYPLFEAVRALTGVTKECLPIT